MGRTASRSSATTVSAVAIVALCSTLPAVYAPPWAIAAVLVVAVVAVLGTLMLVFQRYRSPPLAQTCLPLVACAVVASVAVNAYDTLAIGGVIPIRWQCSVVARWAINVVSFASVVPYLILGWRLRVIFRAGEAEPRCSRWLYTISDAGLMRMFVAAMALPVLITTIQVSTPPLRDVTSPIDSPCALGSNDPASLIFLMTCNMIALIILSSLYLSIRIPSKTFGIHNEIGLVCFAQAIFTIMYLIPLLHRSSSFDPGRFISLGRALACFVSSIAIPLRKSFQTAPPIPIIPQPERALSLSGILSDPLYFTFFNDFVSCDADSPLLEFFMQAKMFPDEEEDEARLHCARRIFDLYLRKDSPRSLVSDVDLDSLEIHRIDRLVHDSCGPLPDDLFAKPLSDVFHQMEHFTLRRFRLSAGFEAMQKEMRRQLLIRERLFFSDMIDGRDLRLNAPLIGGSNDVHSLLSTTS